MSDARPLVLLDSIGHVSETHEGAVVVSGSHGGTAAARYILALKKVPMAVFLNDAGLGKERAGVAGLPMLAERGVIAAAYGHGSARIGEAADGLAHGVVTELNELAAKAGLGIGRSVRESVAHLGASQLSESPGA